MSAAQPAVSLQGQPAPAQKPATPTGFALQSWQKGVLLLILLGILYARMLRRKMSHTITCSHCGKKNPPHLSNCQKCAAPLMRV